MNRDRPLEVRIDRSAIRHNFLVVRRLCPAAKIWSVVKANAYGHGLRHCVAALADLTDGFALVELEEAVALREQGLQLPLLLLEGFFSPRGLHDCVQHRLIPVIHCHEQLAMLSDVARQLPALYLKVNSGMNRLGFAPQDIAPILRQLPSTLAVTLMSHFATADQSTGVHWQMQQLPEAPLPVSLANSAAILDHPDTRTGWVRPGIMLYGAAPTPTSDVLARFDLRPAMRLTARLIAVRHLRAGDRVGYGCTYQAARAMTLGVVSCGYADGYPRHAPSSTPVLVDGMRTTLAGRVSMDMLTVDLSALPHAHVGMPVELWGEHLMVDEVAAAVGTIGYELLCAVQPSLRATFRTDA